MRRKCLRHLIFFYDFVLYNCYINGSIILVKILLLDIFYFCKNKKNSLTNKS